MCTHTFVICIVFKNALKARINEAKTSPFHLLCSDALENK